jgi:hypothetical protein
MNTIQAADRLSYRVLHLPSGASTTGGRAESRPSSGAGTGLRSPTREPTTGLPLGCRQFGLVALVWVVIPGFIADHVYRACRGLGNGDRYDRGTRERSAASWGAATIHKGAAARMTTKALRELDTLIAFHVFNKDVCRVPAEWDPLSWTQGRLRPPDSLFPLMRGPGEEPRSVPHYSTTMSLATEAIARVNRDHGWEVTYRKAADGCEAEVVGVVTRGLVHERGADCPEAACRAILAAAGYLPRD